jgi:hypothetical protein
LIDDDDYDDDKLTTWRIIIGLLAAGTEALRQLGLKHTERQTNKQTKTEVHNTWQARVEAGCFGGRDAGR